MVVAGSLNEDLVVTVGRLPGRGETVIGSAVELLPGGKGANQAAAAGRLGDGVAMVGRVGDDDAGARQLAALREAGVDTALVQATPGVPTGSATIPVEAEGGENLIVVVPGANGEVTPADVDVPAVRGAGVLLLQLETPVPTVVAAARACTGTVVLNPAPAQPLPAELLAEVDVLVPNEHELADLAGAGADDLAGLAGLARGLAARSVVVTLGGNGVLVVPAEGPALHQPPLPVSPVDTTGAGDCFCGALCTALDRGSALAEAVRYAAVAAALSTTGPGARGGLPDDAAVRAALADLPRARSVDQGG
ncbi:ribokinase [Klenkia taihuensis]|nr:ribokinase [Klenkia taihuensis]